MSREQQLEEAVRLALEIMNNESFSMVKRLRRARETLAHTQGVLGEISQRYAQTQVEAGLAEIASLTLERDMLRQRLKVIGRDAMSAIIETRPREPSFHRGCKP